jgi:hypothetical protein
MIAAISAASLSVVVGIVGLAMTTLSPWMILWISVLPVSLTILGGAARVLTGEDDAPAPVKVEICQ